MPRGRMLSKKISYDERVAMLSIEAALLYTWCISHLDAKGRIYGDANIVKGIVVPYREEFTYDIIKKCIKEMENAINKEGVALVLVYGDGRKYIQFMGFTKNQTIREDREAISEIPTPVKTPEENGSLSGETPGQINIKQIKLKQININMSEFETLWNLYPRRDGKKEALKHFITSRKNGKTVNDIKKAINNYIAHLKEEKTPLKYTKTGKVFFNNWEDWLDKDKIKKTGKYDGISKTVND